MGIFDDIFEVEKELKKLRKRLNKLWEFKPSISLRFPEIKFPEIREPLADIEETKDEVKVNVELPGIAKEDIKIDVTPETITIKAEKKKVKEEKKKGLFKAERTYKGFYKELTLPCKVIPEKAEATYRDGILTITIPKAKEARIKKRVKVK